MIGLDAVASEEDGKNSVPCQSPTDVADPQLMRRVLILGCSGAGKSTLARQIAQLTALPIIHLDQHYWLPGWQEPDIKSWLQKVSALIAQPRWVMDGNYGGTLDLRLAAADTAIFLDFPTWVCLGRVLRRVIGSFGRTRDDMAPGCPERVDFSFLRYVYRYRRADRSRHFAAVEAFGGKLIILHRQSEVVDLILRIGQAVSLSKGSETA